MRIIFGCLLVACLCAVVLAQSSSLGARSAAGSGSSFGGLFPLLALSGGGNDAMRALFFCRNMNFLCLMALQGGL